MAHWAELDENKTVLRVVVGDNDDPNGDEGLKWLQDNLGGTWVKTSYNSTFGKKFAAIGDTFDPDNNVFIPEKPFDSWLWDSDKWIWVAPVSYPTDAWNFVWNEDLIQWVEV